MTGSPCLRRLTPLPTLCGLLLLLVIPTFAQPGLNTTGASNCTEADFDTSVQFLNGPGEQFALVIQKRNLANHACVFDGPTYGPSLVPDRIEGQKPISLCYFCEDRLPNGQIPVRSPITVEPGRVALQTFRWKTKTADESIPCLNLKWMAGPILLVTPSLLKPVCSDIDVSRFTLEADSNSEATRNPTPLASAPAFELSAERGLYYTGEFFSLKLTPIAGTAAIVPNPENCPMFYLRERSPDGATRIDEVKPMTSVGCKTFMPGRHPINSESSFEIDSGANSRWMGVGGHALQVWQLTGSADDPRIQFITSNMLQLDVADPAGIARKWGPKIKGIGVDVTLDKETYRLGENIPLHMAVENFESPVPIYSWDPLWDPCMTVVVEVLDERGQPIAASDRFPNQSVCMGHGFGPRPVEKGKLIPIERTLASEGWLPNEPGVYTVRVRWAPCGGTTPPPTGLVTDHRAYKTYAVVQAEATFHIVENGQR
jgi:hypothetical protein